MTLDGELWGGVKAFELTAGLVRSKNFTEDQWEQVVYKGNRLNWQFLHFFSV